MWGCTHSSGHTRLSLANVLTTYNSPTVLTATTPAASVATPGSAALTVHSPGFTMLDLGQTSGPDTFTITARGATIPALDPASAVVGGPAFNLGVTETRFVTGATGDVMRWNGTDLVTTRDSATCLTAAVRSGGDRLRRCHRLSRLMRLPRAEWE